MRALPYAAILIPRCLSRIDLSRVNKKGKKPKPTALSSSLGFHSSDMGDMDDPGSSLVIYILQDQSEQVLKV